LRERVSTTSLFRRRLHVSRLSAALVLAGSSFALLAGSAFAATPTLTGTVGPGYKITLTENGTKVTKLAAGTYTLVIHDKSSVHNFVLEGPGVERDVTTVPFKGSKTVTVKLRHGKFKYYCRPHEPTMFGYVNVG
jgi:plastocyanin